MKKKALAALLSAAMVMTSLIGCGGGAADSAGIDRVNAKLSE